MKMPECACFTGDRIEIENTIYQVAVASAATAEMACTLNGICAEAFPYYAITVVTMLMRGVARSIGGVKNENKNFEEVLRTLVDDVKLRDEILNALIEKRGRVDQ